MTSLWSQQMRSVNGGYPATRSWKHVSGVHSRLMQLRKKRLRPATCLKIQHFRANSCVCQEFTVRFKFAGFVQLFVTPFLRRRNGVCRQVVCSFSRSFVCTPVHPCAYHQNVRLFTANKRLHLEAQFCANICNLRRYLRPPIFILIVNVLDLHFQGQRFESSTFGSSNVMISQMVIDRTNRNCYWMSSHMAFPMGYLHLTLAEFKVQSQSHAHFDCEYLANGDR